MENPRFPHIRGCPDLWNLWKIGVFSGRLLEMGLPYFLSAQKHSRNHPKTKNASDSDFRARGSYSQEVFYFRVLFRNLRKIDPLREFVEFVEFVENIPYFEEIFRPAYGARPRLQTMLWGVRKHNNSLF